jgi:D-alanyl-D-alanine carboxypeptidase (penicillin-binding protein 5/6)
MKKTFLLSFLLCVFGGSSVFAQTFAPPETLAKQAYMLDYDTGAVLYKKNENEKMPTSSMSKVLTAMVVFDALKQGKLSLEQTLPISERAWKMEGSKMFVDVGSQVKVEDLIRGVIIQSGNDACVALAEGVAGSEENFADLINGKAESIGMKDSHFMNASGWPDPNHYSTAHDLALMARYLVASYPEDYKYYSEKEFFYNNIKQGNRNPLLYKNIGADGIKTGHTEEAGYGLIGSAVRGDRRVIMIINGTSSMQERADESTKLIEWALTSFRNLKLAEKDKVYAKAPVVLGLAREVDLMAAQDMKMTVPAFAKNAVSIQAVYPAPLKAPLKAGDAAGKLVITPAGQEPIEVPLVVAQEVPQTGFFARMMENFMLLTVGAPKYQ